MENLKLYRELSDLGPYYPLSIYFDAEKYGKEIETYNTKWVPYNPRKKVERYGLSLYSKDGDIGGVPDLDSLKEYNLLNNTSFQESDFKEPTSIYKNMSSINEALKPLEKDLCRSHILKFNEGGHFPPHRDNYNSENDTFRLIALLKGSSKSNFVVLQSGCRIFFDLYTLYYLDTKIDHAVFSFANDCQILVLNVTLSPESVFFVKNNLQNY